MRVSVIDSEAAFCDLRYDWNTLLQKTKEPHPFHSWEWLYTWWETFAGSKDELKILTIYSGQVLVGIAPFYIKKLSFSKVLKSLGEGEAPEEAVVTHYQDIICLENSKDIVVELIATYMKEHACWHYCEFSFVLDDSCLFSLNQILQPDLMLKRPLGFRYRINLKRSFEEVYNSLGKSARKAFRLKRNRMQKIGELSLDSLNLTKSLDTSLDAHVDFHTHRQQALGREGAFQAPRFKQFHHSLIQRFNRSINLHAAQIRVLNVSNEPIACTLNYLSKEVKEPTIYAYSAGFKSADDSRLSPMFVFDLLEFEHLINNNVSYYDFLSSDDGANYKSTYKADQYEVSRIYWFEKTPLSYAAYVYYKTRSGLSVIKQSLLEYKAKLA